MTAKTMTAESSTSPRADNDRYLDGMERELPDWEARIAKVRARARKPSRSQRVDARKGILVSEIRLRNINRRIAEMRDAPEPRFNALQPGLMLLWRMFISGVEKAES